MSSEHVILNYLDTPARILLWPISEFMTVVVPVFGILVLGFPLLALVIGGVLIGCIRLFKRSFGAGMLEGVLYWYLVHNRSKFPNTLPSYIRELIG